MRFKILFILMVCVTCCVLHVSVANAQENTLEVVPSYIEVTLPQASSEAKISLTYINHANTAVNLELFALDFKQQDETGFITFIGKNSENFSYSLTSFLSLESNNLVLAPHEKKQFTITAQNRQDLSPGGHYAAIIARIASSKDPATAQIAPSVSSFILLRKTGGERYNLSLKSTNWPNGSVTLNYPSTITLEFQNEGNIHVVPYGRVEIRDMFNRLLYKGVINTSSLQVFPETRRLIHVDLTKLNFSFPISFNVLKVFGQDNLQKTQFSYIEAFFYINPWMFGILMVIIIGLIWRKRKKHV